MNAFTRLNSPLLSTPFSVKVAPPPPPWAPANAKFWAILQATCGSLLSIFGNGKPDTNSGILPVDLSLMPHEPPSRSYLPSLASVRLQNFFEEFSLNFPGSTGTTLNQYCPSFRRFRTGSGSRSLPSCQLLASSTHGWSSDAARAWGALARSSTPAIASSGYRNVLIMGPPDTRWSASDSRAWVVFVKAVSQRHEPNGACRAPNGARRRRAAPRADRSVVRSSPSRPDSGCRCPWQGARSPCRPARAAAP